jgi:hypothetical protein
MNIYYEAPKCFAKLLGWFGQKVLSWVGNTESKPLAIAASSRAVMAQSREWLSFYYKDYEKNLQYKHFLL